MGIDTSEEAFRAEEQILTLLRQIRHGNMIQLLASFSITTKEAGLTRCLLFPLADTSLQAVLENESTGLVQSYFQSYEDYLDQIHHLSSALENLHNYFDESEGIKMKGSHFDLAPRNILIQKGKLLLADFGLSRLRAESVDSKTPFKGGAGDLLAPECTVEGFDSYLHGRKSDVWSFGALLSIMVVFVAMGKTGVKEYREARRCRTGHGTTYRFHANGSLNMSMHDWLEDFRTKLLPTDSAILDLALWMLNLQPDERPRMKKVTKYLYLLTQRARFRVIDKQFTDLASKQLAIKLQIENQRFTNWSGVATLGEQWQDPVSEFRDKDKRKSWLRKAPPQVKMDVAKTLQDIQEENNFLLTGLNQELSISPMYLRLHELINFLWDLAPQEERIEMLRMLENSLDRLCDKYDNQFQFMTYAVWYCCQCGMGPQATANNTDCPSCQTEKCGNCETQWGGNRYNSSNTPPWEREALLLATMRFMNTRSQYDSPTGAVRRLAIDSRRVKVKKALGKASIVDLEGNRHSVFCEWINYELHTMDQVPDLLFQRVEAIAHKFSMEPLPVDFSVLHCCGYFHDISSFRFGLLFDYPSLPSAPVGLQPVTLREVMKKQPRPSLECLFGLALTLSKSLHHFHRADWLHKNISSYNVLLFDERLSKAQPTVLDGFPTPYIVGFNHSRPNDPNSFIRGSADIEKHYLHPQYAILPEPRFKHGFDYYSLGLLLLEIGLWEPITSSPLLTGRSILDVEPRELQTLWLNEAVPLLGPRMGKTYKNVVNLCLNDHFVDTSDFFAREDFGKTVVRELERCYV
jgi:serine/threonine protein kinase